MSPFRLFQERYADDPWRLLCCVIMLNQTSGEQLEGIDIELFRRWPSPFEMALASPDDVVSVIRTLGLQCRRARQLIRMSVAYAFLWDGDDPDDLPGIGKYGAQSYLIFIRGRLDIEAEDKKLKGYLGWARE